MRLFNVQVVDNNSSLTPAIIQIHGDKIVEVSTEVDNVIPRLGDLDCDGLIASPGWIDLQINGGFGFDFTSDPSQIWSVGSQLAQYGVTSFLPTIISTSNEVYQNALYVLKKGPTQGWKGAVPIGWHFEGPFLNPDKKGAHNPKYLQLPNADSTKDWSHDHGVLMITMAPELPGALELATEFASRGIILSIGHSMATSEEAYRAVEAGYSAATHLFNAMPVLDHRNPGLATSVLLDKRIITGLISDGIHVHPEMLDLAWRLKGADGIALVTDAVGMLGFPPGSFLQGGMEVIVDEKAARLKNGILAGSILSMDKALRNVMNYTNSRIEQILPAMSYTQSRLLHLDHYGQVKPGFRSDMTLVNKFGQVMMTIIGGEVVYKRE